MDYRDIIKATLPPYCHWCDNWHHGDCADYPPLTAEDIAKIGVSEKLRLPTIAGTCAHCGEPANHAADCERTDCPVN
jgi:hypothetical protein